MQGGCLRDLLLVSMQRSICLLDEANLKAMSPSVGDGLDFTRLFKTGNTMRSHHPAHLLVHRMREI